MSTPSYNKDKYYRIMDITQSNYANQLKRLSRDKKRADFILIYYSLALIIYSLSVKFYPKLFVESWISYSSIILSIIVLVYSVVNSNAEYSARISSIQHALNEVKRLKREVGSLPNFSNDRSMTITCSKGNKCNKYCMRASCASGKEEACEKLNQLKKEYDNLVSTTEIRDDLDFYYTILHLCKKYGINPYTGKTRFRTTPETAKDSSEEIKDLMGYISENNPKLQFLHGILLKLWHAVLYFAPVIIFVLGISPALNMGSKFLSIA